MKFHRIKNAGKLRVTNLSLHNKMSTMETRLNSVLLHDILEQSNQNQGNIGRSLDFLSNDFTKTLYTNKTEYLLKSKK